MNNTMSMNCSKSFEQRPKIHANVFRIHLPVKYLGLFSRYSFKQERRGLYSEIMMTEVGQHGDNLIMMSERRNKRAYRFTTFQVIQELKLVLDSHGAACHVDLLDGDIMRLSG